MNLRELPVNWSQHQGSLRKQLADLAKIADQLGFYDAADFLEGEYVNSSEEESLDPLTDEKGELLQSTLKVNGKSFRCGCGCNVFHRPNKNDLDLYKCNACGTHYQTVAAKTSGVL